MNQLTQQLKLGKMEVMEVPFPALNCGEILVRNHYSVISSGTEGKTVSDARKGYIAKAKSRQKEVKQVIEMIKTNGLFSTYKLVMNKLEAPSPLGYSTAGEVIAIGENVSSYKVGDYVACGGNSASHADVVAVPQKLIVKVPESVSLNQAAFTTLGSIAIQGIRQADLRLGENCLIIGMGLIGQLTYKILESSGMRPLGVDISDSQVQFCRKHKMENVYLRRQSGIEELISEFTRGYGADTIIITAGTASLDPVEFAGEMARKKGKVVIVGAVPTGFSRENYYKKELDLRMSSSYGPGRNDSDYENKGRDYPIGYVRWTENRNMQSFVDLLESGSLDISSLITHTFSLQKAAEAYDVILENKETYSGILIEYDTEKELRKKIDLGKVEAQPGDVNTAFIGAGSFAQNMLLPVLKGKCNFVGVVTGRGTTARHVADKFGFSYCTESANDIYSDDHVNTLFITTRHNMHAEQVIDGIKNGKHVFVEKPLAMNESELEKIRTVYNEAAASGKGKHLMVGFNRRFSPAVKKLMEIFPAKQKKSIQIRVNAGAVPKGHWINDPEIGGGRIIGEVCHFIDLAMYLGGGNIISVSAETMDIPENVQNTVSIQLKMDNGSIASINYYSNGNKQVPKESIELFCGGSIAVIDDFKTLMVYGKDKKKYKFKGQDKGHAAEIDAFLNSIKKGGECPVSFNESYMSTLATCKVIESIAQNRKIML